MKIGASNYLKKIILSLFLLPFLSNALYSKPNISPSELAELGVTLSRPILLANKLSKYKNLTLNDLDSVKQVNRASLYYSLSRLISESLSFYNRPGRNVRYLLPALCVDAVESFTHFFSGHSGDKTLLNIAQKKHVIAISIDVLESLLASYQILSNSQSLKKSEKVFQRGLYGLSLLVRYSNELYLYSANKPKMNLYITALSLLSVGLCNDLIEFKNEAWIEREERQRVERECHEREIRERHEARQRVVREERQRVAREAREERQRQHEEWLRGLNERRRQREEQARRAAQERAERERQEREHEDEEEGDNDSTENPYEDFDDMLRGLFERLNAQRASRWDNPESQEYIRNSRRAEAADDGITTLDQARERIRTGQSVQDIPDRFLYQVMDIPETSSWNDVRRRYRVLARENHPDRNPQNADESRGTWDTISNAYSELNRRINQS